MKYTYAFASAVFVVALLAMTSCSIQISPVSVKTIEKTFDLRDFNAIDLECHGDVVYTQGDNYSINVKASSCEMDALKLDVTDSVLTIRTVQDKLCILGGNVLTLYISSPRLENVNVAGSGNFKSEKDLHAANLTLNVPGSGNISLGKTFTTSLEATVDGSGDVAIDWLSAYDASYTVIGSGDVKSKEYQTNNSRVYVSGSGDISIDYDKCKHADVQLSGSGDVTLSGTLGSLSQKKSGSGDIRTYGIQKYR